MVFEDIDTYSPIRIPKQLRNDDFRFVKIHYKGKIPYEKAWPMLESEYEKQEDGSWVNKETGKPYMITNPDYESDKKDDMAILGIEYKIPYTGKIHNYKFDEMEEHLTKNKINYGVLTGFNGLGVLDDDTEDKVLIKLFEENFGDTFKVNEHEYMILKGWNGEKIIFYDKEGKHCGELQGKGQQVVGCGSIHPTGKEYELKNDLPIKEIDFDVFNLVFSDYIVEKKEVPQEYRERTNWEGEDIKDIPINSVISLGGLSDVGGGCLQGPHPYHGSEGGMNFRVDTLNNTWVCFRCNKGRGTGGGGGSPELIAVMEGIIDCSEAGKGCLAGDKGSQVIKIAREKYGLKAPEKKEQNKPMGWANSVNIKRLAERMGLTNCPKCNIPFEFNEYLGNYKCSSCGDFGGLKMFAGLCLAKRMEVTQ